MRSGGKCSTGQSFDSFTLAAPLRCGIGRAALSLGFAREESLEIRDRQTQQARIVVEITDAQIAPATEQAAHLLGHVAMIDAESLLRLLAADGARAALPRQQRVVVVDREPVRGFEATISQALSPFLRLVVGIFRPVAACSCGNFFLMRRIPRAIAGTNLFCVLRIFHPPSPLGSNLVLVRRVPGAIVGTSLRCMVRILPVASRPCLNWARRHGAASRHLWRRGGSAAATSIAASWPR